MINIIVDESLPVAPFRVGGPGDPDRLPESFGVVDELWDSSGGCPCGRYHGQRDGAMIHCGFDSGKV